MAESSKRAQPNRKDHFLELMLYHQSDRPASGAPPRRPEHPVSDPLAPLHSFLARPGVRYGLPPTRKASAVQIDSPATEVMTDLRVVNPVTVSPDASVDAANQLMIDHRVRALFVVDDAARHILGVITSTDILGERPLQVAQGQKLRHSDLVVRDIMTAAEKLEVLDLQDIARAHVGNIVATLQRAGRQHALAVERPEGSEGAVMCVCGIFSLTQIARHR